MRFTFMVLVNSQCNKLKDRFYILRELFVVRWGTRTTYLRIRSNFYRLLLILHLIAICCEMRLFHLIAISLHFHLLTILSIIYMSAYLYNHLFLFHLSCSFYLHFFFNEKYQCFQRALKRGEARLEHLATPRGMVFQRSVSQVCQAPRVSAQAKSG